MKKFIVKIVILSSLVLCGVVLVGVFFPVNPNDYLAAYDQKLNRLTKTHGSKLVFVGGSNLAFGLDSKRIQDSLQMPVVNMALHAGMGLKFMLDDLNQYVSSGDKVVVAAEYSHFYGSMNGEASTLGPLMRYTEWNKLHLLNGKQWKVVCAGLPDIIKHGFTNVNQYSYLASNFKEFGDEEKHWSLGRRIHKVSPGSLPSQRDEEGCEYIGSVLKEMQQKGVDIYMIPPVILKSHFQGVASQVKQIEAYWKNKGFSYLVAPSQLALPDSCGYDTPYHMNKSGVDRYTEIVIKTLKPYL